MFAFAKGNYFITAGSRIIGALIDMSGGIISNHAQPILPSDVANKEYVDLRIPIGPNAPVIITLTGTNYTTISTQLTGNFMISVKNVVVNGPSATFTVVKSNSSSYPGCARISSFPGTTSNEKLDISWDPGSGIKLKKTGNNYDGNYSIFFINSHV